MAESSVRRVHSLRGFAILCGVALAGLNVVFLMGPWVEASARGIRSVFQLDFLNLLLLPFTLHVLLFVAFGWGEKRGRWAVICSGVAGLGICAIALVHSLRPALPGGAADMRAVVGVLLFACPYGGLLLGAIQRMLRGGTLARHAG